MSNLVILRRTFFHIYEPLTLRWMKDVRRRSWHKAKTPVGVLPKNWCKCLEKRRQDRKQEKQEKHQHLKKRFTRCRQHPRQDSEAWRTRCHQCLNRRMSENLDQWTMAQGLYTATDYPSSEKRQHTTLPEQRNNQPPPSPNQGNTTSDSQHYSKNQAEQILEEEKVSFRSLEYYWTDIQLKAVGGRHLADWNYCHCMIATGQPVHLY